ncbi:MAG: hypothetical protein ACREEM_37990 [Blastocatellia bacterium]
MNNYLKCCLLVLALLIALNAVSSAQGPPGKPKPWGPGAGPPPDRRGERPPGPPGADWERRPGPDSRFQSFEMFSDNKVVKSAPYSATAVIETVQTLQDGSKLTRKKTDTIYRDSEGRTRREQQFDRVGPFPVEGEPHQVVFIHDAVSGQRIFLDPSRRTARKMPGGDRPQFQKTPPFRPPPGNEGERKTESLGKQTIEGIEVEGTRTTFTIPAGRIGNDRPLETVSERWESPELQIVVFSKHKDPFVGETTYRLTNIKRDEPPRTLFEVPADYAVEEARPGDPRHDGPRRRPKH